MQIFIYYMYVCIYYVRGYTNVFKYFLRRPCKKSGNVAATKWQILIISAVNGQQKYILTCLQSYTPFHMCVCECMRVVLTLFRLCGNRALACRAGGSVCATGIQGRSWRLQSSWTPFINCCCLLLLLLLCFAVLRSSFGWCMRVLKFSRAKYWFNPLCKFTYQSSASVLPLEHIGISTHTHLYRHIHTCTYVYNNHKCTWVRTQNICLLSLVMCGCYVRSPMLHVASYWVWLCCWQTKRDIFVTLVVDRRWC